MKYKFAFKPEPFQEYSESDEYESFNMEFASDWQGEISRVSPDYIRWVQQSLNKILGLRLAEDGIVGSKTRSAIRSFQRRRGLELRPDGVICPQTERALIAAGANPSPSMGVPFVARSLETAPPGRTVYVDIPLQIPLGNAKSMTGIFIPEDYCPLSPVDIIVYLHGFKLRSNKSDYSIDAYWRLPQFLLREEVNKSKKNVILVAPTLGPKNEPGALTCPGGFDKFLDRVIVALKQYGPYGGQKTPSIGNIILACHSGSGSVMRAIAMGTDASANRIQEYWAFDPFNMGGADGWANWARSHPKAKLYIYYRPNNPGQRLCESLIGKSVPNVSAVKCKPNVLAVKSAVDHDELPTRYLKERIQGAQFLVDKSNCPSYRTRERTSAITNKSRFREAPLDFSTESDELVELWNSDLAEEVWQEHVPRKSPDYIRWVQRSLNKALRLRLAEDGIAGPLTRSAIRNFQRREGLSVTGIIGSNTEGRLIAETGDIPNPTYRVEQEAFEGEEMSFESEDDEKVLWIQTVLNAVQGERLKVDGDYGDNTRGALKRFQEQHGLLVTGEVDQATNTALIQRALEEIRKQSLFSQIGVMDNQTLEEIKHFQSENSLKPDGLVGRRTRKAMVNKLSRISPKPTKPVVGGKPYPEVNTPMPPDGPGFIRRKRKNQELRSYGLSETIQALQEIAAEWHRANPQRPRIIINDISPPGGSQGRFEPHSSHRVGLDVDLNLEGGKSAWYYKGQDNKWNPNPAYSRSLTKELADLILKHPKGGLMVKFILFNDPEVISVNPKKVKKDKSSPHYDHFHVRFCAPDYFKSKVARYDTEYQSRYHC